MALLLTCHSKTHQLRLGFGGVVALTITQQTFGHDGLQLTSINCCQQMINNNLEFIHHRL